MVFWELKQYYWKKSLKKFETGCAGLSKNYLFFIPWFLRIIIFDIPLNISELSIRTIPCKKNRIAVIIFKRLLNWIFKQLIDLPNLITIIYSCSVRVRGVVAGTQRRKFPQFIKQLGNSYQDRSSQSQLFKNFFLNNIIVLTHKRTIFFEIHNSFQVTAFTISYFQPTSTLSTAVH